MEDQNIREEILQQHVIHLHVHELSKVFDADDSCDLIQHIAREFGFTPDEINRIRAYQTGGGEPHQKFIEFLSGEGIMTEDLISVFVQLGFRPNDVLQHLLDDKEKCSLSEYTPEELRMLGNYFVGDCRSVHIIRWQNLAENLDYAHLVGSFEEVKGQDGVYSGTIGLFRILEKKEVEIRKLQEVISTSGNKRALEHFEKVLDAMVTQKKRRTAREEKGRKEKEKKEKEKRGQGSKENDDLEIDDSDHCCQMHTSWYVWCHQSRQNNPSRLLDNFHRSKYAPDTLRYLFYEHGEANQYSVVNLNNECLVKFNEQYSEDIERSISISKRWLLTNLHEDCVDNPNFYSFCKTLERSVADYQISKYTFLLLDYDYRDHLKKMEFKVEELMDDLQIRQRDDPRNRVLLYLAEKQMILNITFVDASSTDCNPDSNCKTKKRRIMDAMRKSQNDLMLFSSLHMEALRNSNICLTGLVAVNDVSDEELQDFELCSKCNEHLVITKNDLANDKTLQIKLKSIINIRCKIKREPMETIKRTFMELASNIWGFLSLKDVHLPNMSSDIVRIFLNNDQRHILRSKDHHVILRGPYGSGKSILAQAKFKELINVARVNDYIYFICFCNETLYTDTIRSHMTEVLHHNLRAEQVNIFNADEYARKFGLPTPIMVSDVLANANYRHSADRETPHVVIDELDGSSMTTEESVRIKSSLREDSYVLIVAQSLQVARKKVTRKGILRKNTLVYDGYQFERTGMKVKTLDLTMRNSTRINALSRVAVKTFAKHTSTYFERVAGVGTTNASPKNTDDSNSPSTSETKIDTVMAYTTDVLQLSEEIHKEEETRSTLAMKTIQSSTMEREKEQEGEVMVVDNFDHCFKAVGTNTQQYTGNRFQNTFSFPGEWEHGHCVKGVIPKIVYPFPLNGINYENVNIYENKARMMFTLNKIIDIRSLIGQLAILCFDKIEALLMLEIIKAMDISVIVNAPALFGIKKKIDNLENVMRTNILITDHVGARGLEFKCLVVAFDPNDPYLQHYLLEAFTRSISKLYFVVVKKDAGRQKEEGIFEMIIKKWKKKKLIEQHEVKVCRKHVSEDHTAGESCNQGDGIHKIHLWHKYFQRCEDVNEIRDAEIDVAAMQKHMLSVSMKREEEVLAEFDNRGIDYIEELIKGDEQSKLLLIVTYKKECLKLRGSFNYTPLLYAAKYGKVDIMKLLIDHGSSVNEVDEYGNTILHVVVLLRNDICFEYICKHHPTLINMKDKYDWTALHYAASNGKLQYITTLLNAGANTSVKNKYGETPLDYAERNGHKECAKELEKWR